MNTLNQSFTCGKYYRFDSFFFFTLIEFLDKSIWFTFKSESHLLHYQINCTKVNIKTLCYNNYLQSNCNSNLTHTLTRSFNLNGNLREKSVGLGLSFSFLQELKIRLLILMDLAISDEYLAVVKPLWYPTLQGGPSCYHFQYGFRLS